MAAAAVAFGRRRIDVDRVELSFRTAFAAMSKSINTQLPIVVIDSLYGPLAEFENDVVTRQIAECGSHTRNEIAMLRHFIDTGDLVYDIGAHIGMFAIPLAEAVGDDGRVIAVEADPNNFPLLWQNLRSRDLIGRVAACMASLAERAVGTRHTERSATRATTYFVADPAGAPAVTFALDDLHACFAHGRRASVIKIDVEGMELSVLRSGRRVIERDRRACRPFGFALPARLQALGGADAESVPAGCHHRAGAGTSAQFGERARRGL